MLIRLTGFSFIRAVAAALCLLCVAVPWAAPAATLYGPGDTGVVNVSNSADVAEAEEPLAVNPLDPNQLTAVANVFQVNAPPPLDLIFGGGGVQDTRLYTSSDGGRHWKTLKLDQGGIGSVTTPIPKSNGFSPEFSDTLNVVNTDAASVWDRHGNAYFESGDIHGIHHNGNEVETVWRSTDSGATWGPKDGVVAVNATDEHSELDRPWLAVDNSGGAHDGRVYSTFETSPFVDIPPQVYVKYTDDHGATWSPTFRVDDGVYETQFNARNRPVVGANGALYVVYDRAAATNTPFTTQQIGGIQLVLARSTDGGRTFSRFVADDNVHRVASPDEALASYVEMIPAIATDPAVPGRVAVAWPEATSADSSRVVMRYSTDGGAHWSRRVDVADDLATRNDQHDHVTLAWEPNGPLFAGWRDRRCCGGAFGSSYQQWVRAIDTSGAAPALGATLQYSDGPQPDRNDSAKGAGQPDEFQGLVASAKGAGLTWAQLSGAYTDLYFRNVPLSAFGFGTQPGCVDTRRFAFTLHGLPRQRVIAARIYIDGRLVQTSRGRRLRHIAIAALPQGSFTVRIVATTRRGDRVVSMRSYSGCAKSPPTTRVVHRRHRR